LVKAGVARQRVDPISLGIAPRACTILSKLLLLLLLLALLLLLLLLPLLDRQKLSSV
jgi:quinol-cytochrome oxidoreductase complex cytochrome b subunit